MESAFARRDRPATPLRSRLEIPGGELLLMPAHGPEGMGVKLVTMNPSNPGRGLPLLHAQYLLFDADTLASLALFDGSALTAVRTSAVSALATRHLARAGASRLVLFGAGVQATAHLEGIHEVCPLSSVRIVSRSRERAERLVRRAQELGLDAAIAGPDAVREADLICTCTTSAEPLFSGDLLAEGTHVNAVGAYRPDMRELDSEAVARSRVVVETREAALAEAGDLLIPIEEGAIEASHVLADLGEVVGGAPIRHSDADITLFKSVGVAFEDLAVARAAYDRM